MKGTRPWAYVRSTIDDLIDEATEAEMKLSHLREVVADVLASEPLPDDSAKKLLRAMEATRWTTR